MVNMVHFTTVTILTNLITHQESTRQVASGMMVDRIVIILAPLILLTPELLVGV